MSFSEGKTYDPGGNTADNVAGATSSSCSKKGASAKNHTSIIRDKKKATHKADPMLDWAYAKLIGRAFSYSKKEIKDARLESDESGPDSDESSSDSEESSSDSDNDDKKLKLDSKDARRDDSSGESFIDKALKDLEFALEEMNKRAGNNLDNHGGDNGEGLNSIKVTRTVFEPP